MKQPGPISSSLAAVGSVIAATACCLPLGTMWLAAGAAGASTLLGRFRPWLMGLSFALIVFGFWQARRARSCSPARRRFNMALLLLSTLFIGASLLLPAYWSAGQQSIPAGQPPLVAVSSVEQLRSQWNAAATTTNILVLLSPT